MIKSWVCPRRNVTGYRDCCESLLGRKDKKVNRWPEMPENVKCNSNPSFGVRSMKSLWESVSVFAYCHKLLNLFTFLSRVNNWKPIEFDSPIPLIPFTQKKKKIEEDFHSANWQKDLLVVPTQIEGLTRNFQCRLLCPSYPESPLPRCPTQREKTGKSFIYRQQQEQQQT